MSVLQHFLAESIPDTPRECEIQYERQCHISRTLLGEDADDDVEAETTQNVRPSSVILQSHEEAFQHGEKFIRKKNVSYLDYQSCLVENKVIGATYSQETIFEKY